MRIPEDCAPGTYRLVREYFIANYLDGDEGGRVTVDASVLADTVAELFSSSHWTETWNEALLKELRRAAGADEPTENDLPQVVDNRVDDAEGRVG